MEYVWGFPTQEMTKIGEKSDDEETISKNFITRL